MYLIQPESKMENLLAEGLGFASIVCKNYVKCQVSPDLFYDLAQPNYFDRESHLYQGDSIV
ncbi:hypothetical protein ABES80_15365 [Bacillus gobiensis]|uniref:hypothetical protein n=1 Tax=Bacillus gobiensis TaxID=1441095 RepID=UPI003D241082